VLVIVVKALIAVENINYLNIFPVFNILTIDVPKNSKKVGACKNDNDKLSNFINLNNHNRFHNRIAILIVIILNILLKLFAIVLTYYMLKIFHVEKLE
jgi:hypothetical protein